MRTGVRTHECEDMHFVHGVDSTAVAHPLSRWLQDALDAEAIQKAEETAHNCAVEKNSQHQHKCDASRCFPAPARLQVGNNPSTVKPTHQPPRALLVPFQIWPNIRSRAFATKPTYRAESDGRGTCCPIHEARDNAEMAELVCLSNGQIADVGHV